MSAHNINFSFFTLKYWSLHNHNIDPIPSTQKREILVVLLHETKKMLQYFWPSLPTSAFALVWKYIAILRVSLKCGKTNCYSNYFWTSGLHACTRILCINWCWYLHMNKALSVSVVHIKELLFKSMLFARPYCSAPAPYRRQTGMQANRNKWTAQCVEVPSDFNYSYKRAVKRWCYLRRFIVCYTRRANYANAFGLLVQPQRGTVSHTMSGLRCDEIQLRVWLHGVCGSRRWLKHACCHPCGYFLGLYTSEQTQMMKPVVTH